MQIILLTAAFWLLCVFYKRTEARKQFGAILCGKRRLESGRRRRSGTKGSGGQDGKPLGFPDRLEMKEKSQRGLCLWPNSWKPLCPPLLRGGCRWDRAQFGGRL